MKKALLLLSQPFGASTAQAARLAVSYIGARLMSVITLFVAAWFFRIEAFAEFGVYSSLLGLAWVLVVLRYEAAIVAAHTEGESQAALRLCLFIGAGLWCVCTFIALFLGWADLIRVSFALIFPFALLARIFMRLASMVATRKGDFHSLGRYPLVQALVQPFALLALALAHRDGALCLALADLTGFGVAALYLVLKQRPAFWNAFRKGAIRTSVIARQWASLPLVNLPGSLLSLAFVTAPLVLTPLIADAASAGRVALVYRLFDIPTQIVGAAATPVLMNLLRPSDDREGGLFGRAMMLTFATGIVGLYALGVVALVAVEPWMIGTVFEKLSRVAPLVALFLAGIAIASPLAEACTLYRRQRFLTFIHALALAGAGLAYGLSGALTPLNVLTVLAFFSIARAAFIGEWLREVSMLHQRRDMGGDRS